MRVFLISLFLLIAGCSIDQVRVEQQLASSPNQGAVFQLRTSASAKARNVRTVELRRGTRWRLLGSIERGTVFEPLDQVVTVNGYNVHEAYIVVQDDQLVGYYLPYENSFVEADAVVLELVETEE